MKRPKDYFSACSCTLRTILARQHLKLSVLGTSESETLQSVELGLARVQAWKRVAREATCRRAAWVCAAKLFRADLRGQKCLSSDARYASPHSTSSEALITPQWHPVPVARKSDSSQLNIMHTVPLQQLRARHGMHSGFS